MTTMRRGEIEICRTLFQWSRLETIGAFPESFPTEMGTENSAMEALMSFHRELFPFKDWPLFIARNHKVLEEVGFAVTWMALAYFTHQYHNDTVYKWGLYLNDNARRNCQKVIPGYCMKLDFYGLIYFIGIS